LVIDRGDIWWVELSEPRGSAPGFRRPGVVVQSDLLNETHINTTVVVMLTTNARLGDIVGNVRLSARVTGLPKDSVAVTSQIMTVDRSQLIDFVGRLPAGKMRSIEVGLRLVLEL
jgi:mRNA interferase MazF